MKKVLLIFIVLCFTMQGMAQSPVLLSYPETENEEVATLMGVLDVYGINARLEGDIKGKKAVLTRYTVSGDEVTTVDFPIYRALSADTIVIKVMARRLSEDKIRMDVRIKDEFYSIEDIEIAENKQILIETYLEPESESDRNIPVFAYAAGIRIEMEGGYFIHYCGLRDAKVHPSLWKEQFGITDYVYYTINFQE